MINPKIIVALDFQQREDVDKLVKQLTPQDCALKIGKELFTSCGPDLVKTLVAQGFKLFLDLKFHDIPNTVAKASVVATKLGVWMLNVHVAGGRTMLEAAVQAAKAVNPNILMIGVTVLTNLTQNDLIETGIKRSLHDQVMHLAKLAKDSGLDGVVCSAQEATSLKQSLGKDFILVTPGVRPILAQQDDQKRIMTPQQAIAVGSDYLVIGRPITQAANPSLALQQIQQAINS